MSTSRWKTRGLAGARRARQGVNVSRGYHCATSSGTAAISLRKTVGPMFEVACHEGNYAIENILRGLRALDGTPREPTSEPGIICSDCEAPR